MNSVREGNEVSSLNEDVNGNPGVNLEKCLEPVKWFLYLIQTKPSLILKYQTRWRKSQQILKYQEETVNWKPGGFLDPSVLWEMLKLERERTSV